MIIRTFLLPQNTKFDRPIFQLCLLCQSVSHRSNFSSSSFSPYRESGIPNLANYRDWLSPNEVVKIFESLKDPNFALPVFDQISQRKDYNPNEAVYTIVIKKLALAKNFDAIEALMERIKLERKCRLSEEFFLTVMKVYGNVGGRIDSAIKTLFDMPDFKCWPSVKSFNFVLNLLVNTKQFEVVHEVYMGASKLGVEADACSLNIIIKGLCQCGKLDAAFSVLDEFSKQNLRPGVRTYSTLMHGLCEHARVDDALALLDRMERGGVDPDAVTFNILISGLRKKRRVDEGIKLFDSMMLKGCDPNPGTYQEVLYCFLDDKKFAEAKEFMHRMMSKNIPPSFESYKLLIQGFCRENLVGEVDWALKQMVRHGFVPKMGMWKSILRCLFSGKDNCHPFSYEEIMRSC
ncbi:OLC1v1023381C1 [Oldenlandia corymbosa var. corymbosa]|uniref:OLC1v1023381C1 n=1 Tax=Oldenlandia corymbosa var. corymbosa TaxID=529605 RepID=A0AAV1C059_OLDCO|nr:OLC1v1023381C1 [Oldenlandia corymbosa var. corymbosa]